MTPHDDRPSRRRACHHADHRDGRNVEILPLLPLGGRLPRGHSFHREHLVGHRIDDGDDRTSRLPTGCLDDRPSARHDETLPNATRRSAALPNAARQGVILRSGTHWSVPWPDETHRDAAHQPGDRPSEARPSAPDEANSVGTNPTRDEENGRSA